jgi:hypothetical protein
LFFAEFLFLVLQFAGRRLFLSKLLSPGLRPVSMIVSGELKVQRNEGPGQAFLAKEPNIVLTRVINNC